MSVKRFVLVLFLVTCSASSALGLPLITSVAEFGTMPTGLDPEGNGTTDPQTEPPQGPVVSSFSSPGPTNPTTLLPTSFGMFDVSNGQEEPFQFSDRTHEYTNPRTNPDTGVLTTAVTIGTTPTIIRAIPWYLRGTDQNADTLPDGLEYIQIANDNRAITDYRLDVTLAAPVTAFLMLDNRNNGPTSTLVGASNIDDPVLGGPLQWVIDDGWARVRSGQMPNGQGDMLGSDEGATFQTAAERVHHDPGPGVGLNQFYSIYRKDFTTSGLKTGFTKANGIPGGSTYTVAVRPLMTIPILVGDVNFDGAVNSADYTIIRTNFQQTGKLYGEGDISGDGTVDFSDFRLWKSNKTVPGSTAGFEAELSGLVPEPGSLMLLVMGAVSLAVTSSRRR